MHSSHDTPGASPSTSIPSPEAATVLRIDDANGVRTITLHRPERLNAVNAALAEALPAALLAAHRDDAVRVVVLTGAGRAFCAGLDLAEPVALTRATRAETFDPYYWVGRWVHAVVQCEKPVIAAINGVAAGAGFALALAADIRLWRADATATAGYVRRGLSPDAGMTWTLPRLAGVSRATEFILSGRAMDAVEAERWGLAARVLVPELFAEEVTAYAAALAAGPPIALALTKRLLASSGSATLDQQLREELTHIKSCFATADVQEAVVAFQEKRAPVFRGR